MMKRYGLFLLLLPFLCAYAPGIAAFSSSDAVIKSGALAGEKFHAIPDGREMTFADMRGMQTLIAFWRSDCPPCVRERPMLDASARAHPQIHVVLVTLDGNAYKERHFPAPRNDNMHIWAADNKAEAVLSMAGDKRMALPFSIFMRADGGICDTHYGLLGTDKVSEWVKRC